MRWLFLLLLIGCGDDGKASGQDGGPGEDSQSGSDGSVDGPPQASCDYTELRDGTNDTLQSSGIAEATGVQVDTTVKTLCGSIASDHFDGDITVDADAYHFTIATEGDYVVRFEANAASLELSGVEVYSGSAFDTLVGKANWYGDHGVTSVHLAPGTYELLAFALNSAAITAPIDYRIKLTLDSPTRCVAITTGGIVESHDGANSAGNDVYTIPNGNPIALTPSNADTPEAGGTITPGTDVRFSGSLADVAVTDQYEDKDTFSFDVPNGANELGVRLDWQGTGDLDIMLFEGTVLPPEVRVIGTATTGPETLFYSIKAGVTYNILFGVTTGATLPIAYSATLCAASYVP